MFKDLFGVEWIFLKMVQTFGFFVALSFLAANVIMIKELKRKQKLGLVESKKEKIWIGRMSGWDQYFYSALTGFILGWKILYAVLNMSIVSNNPQEFILSFQGSVVYGILGAILLVGYRYYTENKEKLAEPYEEEKDIQPFELMGNITLIAAVTGFLGAKIFHHLENWDEFMENPIGALTSPFSGLTFYGGLIFGAIGVLWYARKNGIKPLHMLDVGAPAMMLSYATGRIGCQMSGDGDWGIVNTAVKPNWMSFLPDWMWSYNYPNNVNNVCNPYTGAEQLMHPCNWAETPYLIAPVFPTPFYETVVCLLLFGVIWYFRKRIKVAGVLFGVYLILNGLERFFIEKIRVNTEYHILGMNITQAEIISFSFILIGAIGIYVLTKRSKQNPSEPKDVVTEKQTE
jgi:prolipoprotein diacylglyceryl transferase